MTDSLDFLSRPQPKRFIQATSGGIRGCMAGMICMYLVMKFFC